MLTADDTLRAEARREIANPREPIDRLLLETDAPDQPLQAHRGERNEPAMLDEVCATIAGLRGESHESVAAATTRNARALFGI